MFACYIEYLYSGKFTTFEMDEAEEQFLELTDIYILAHKLNDSTVQDAAISTILSIRAEEHEDGVQYFLYENKIAETVWKYCSGTSKLWKLLVDMYLWEMDPDSLPQDLEGLPKPFANDLLKAVLTKMHNGGQAPGMPDTVSCCDYHEHEPGAACKNRKRKRAADDIGGK